MSITGIILTVLAVAIVLFIGVIVYSFYTLVKILKETDEIDLLYSPPQPMLNIYEIIHEDGEKEWCTGSTNIDALSHYIKTSECDFHDMGDAEIIEVPKWKWSQLWVVNEDKSETSFEDWMKNYGHRREIICGTMYDY